MIGLLMRLGLSRGLLGGSKFFGVLGLIALLFNFAQRASGNAPKTLYTRKLKPGESIIVSEPASNSNKR
jgi:hypothetical protein